MVVYSMRIPYLYSLRIIKSIPNVISINIVPDLPIYMRMGNQSFLNKILINLNQKINIKLQDKIDGYVLYSEKMREVLNCGEKNWVVIEGILDKGSCKYKNHSRCCNNDKRIILYAGGIEEKYGLKNLIEGFLMANLVDTELHIYGAGSFVGQIKQYTENYNEIKFFGTVSPYVAREKISEADLLINPRPTNEMYTAFSCPSKTLEYMSSGRPVMMTNLPGVPREYYDYVFLIEDESALGIATSLNSFFQIPEIERQSKAIAAQKFIHDKKNIDYQVSKLIELAKNLFNYKFLK